MAVTPITATGMSGFVLRANTQTQGVPNETRVVDDRSRYGRFMISQRHPRPARTTCGQGEARAGFADTVRGGLGMSDLDLAPGSPCWVELATAPPGPQHGLLPDHSRLGLPHDPRPCGPGIPAGDRSRRARWPGCGHTRARCGTGRSTLPPPTSLPPARRSTGSAAPCWNPNPTSCPASAPKSSSTTPPEPPSGSPNPRPMGLRRRHPRRARLDRVHHPPRPTGRPVLHPALRLPRAPVRRRHHRRLPRLLHRRRLRDRPRAHGPRHPSRRAAALDRPLRPPTTP